MVSLVQQQQPSTTQAKTSTKPPKPARQSKDVIKRVKSTGNGQHHKRSYSDPSNETVVRSRTGSLKTTAELKKRKSRGERPFISPPLHGAPIRPGDWLKMAPSGREENMFRSMLEAHQIFLQTQVNMHRIL
eukprot:sb/3475087/